MLLFFNKLLMMYNTYKEQMEIERDGNPGLN